MGNSNQKAKNSWTPEQIEKWKKYQYEQYKNNQRNKMQQQQYSNRRQVNTKPKHSENNMSNYSSINYETRLPTNNHTRRGLPRPQMHTQWQRNNGVTRPENFQNRMQYDKTNQSRSSVDMAHKFNTFSQTRERDDKTVYNYLLQKNPERQKSPIPINKAQLKQDFFKPKNKIEKEIEEFKSNFDPCDILNIPKNHSLEQLKKKYKTMALHTHPDHGGNTKMFQMVTKAYFILLQEHKSKRGNNSFEQLKNNTQTYYEDKPQRQNPNVNQKGFNLDQFNKIYQDNRIGDVYDEGYEDWKNDNPLEDKDIENIFTEKFSMDLFNKTFQKQKDKNPQNKIIKYSSPEAMQVSEDIGHTVLGQERINDYTKSYNINSKNNITYTDYKKAHTETTLINPRLARKRENTKSLKQLQQKRSNISYEMSNKDRDIEEKHKKKMSELEEFRQQRLKKTDIINKRNHDKLNQLLIGFR